MARYLIIAAVVPQIYLERFVALLRREGLDVALSVLFMAIGVASAIVYRSRRDAPIGWFALFAFLYGVRLAVSTQVIRLATGIRMLPALFVNAFLTYTILLPLTGFLYAVFPGWRPVLRRVAVFLAVFAVAGTLSDAITRRPFSLGLVNSVVVLSGLAALVFATFHSTMRPLRAGFLVFLFTAMQANLSGLGAFNLPLNTEPIGFAIFLGTLGHVLVRRAIDNQERLVALDNELEIAKRIQNSILPGEMPRTPRVAIAARYLPMTAVAGDFYDFLEPGGDRVGILVADVSGHGVPAALIASMVKVAISAQLAHADDPAKVLAGMNDVLRGKLQRQFVTAAYLFLDLDVRRLRYSAAGHPPLLWRHAATGEVEEIKENGLVLGMFSKAKYRTLEREMAPGDRFLLYTDGLLEAMNAAGEQFGAERLRGLLTGPSASPPEQQADALAEAIGRWAGPAREDDLTMLVVDVA